mgnify:FL=1
MIISIINRLFDDQLHGIMFWWTVIRVIGSTIDDRSNYQRAMWWSIIWAILPSGDERHILIDHRIIPRTWPSKLSPYARNNKTKNITVFEELKQTRSRPMPFPVLYCSGRVKRFNFSLFHCSDHLYFRDTIYTEVIGIWIKQILCVSLPVAQVQILPCHLLVFITISRRKEGNGYGLLPSPFLLHWL